MQDHKFSQVLASGGRKFVAYVLSTVKLENPSVEQIAFLERTAQQMKSAVGTYGSTKDWKYDWPAKPWMEAVEQVRAIR